MFGGAAGLGSVIVVKKMQTSWELDNLGKESTRVPGGWTWKEGGVWKERLAVMVWPLQRVFCQLT